MISYQKLFDRLNAKNINKSQLSDILGISSRTIAKFGKGEVVSDIILKKIANYLECNVEDLYKEVSPNKLLQLLRDEKEAKIKGGFYHELQVRMTYNSNHIEGSKLSEDQTRFIYETSTIETDGAVPVDDILETLNHFKAIDYVIDVAEEPLTEEIIKHLHYLLKQNTSDSNISWFAVGDYKKRANSVGGKETAKPEDVSRKIQNLLYKYNSRNNISIENIVEFHVDFERIHPFQDGNGRVGRLIALKECLKNNIIPFIIEDSKKAYYYKGLSSWNIERNFLIETCLDGQDTIKDILTMLDISID